MRRLLTFLVRYHYWFLFFILEAASLVLLFKFNGYQQSVLFTSAGEVAGRIYSVENVIKEYLDLKDINKDLQRRNMELERRATYAESLYKNLLADSLHRIIPQEGDNFTFIGARVINNTLHKPDNFITLNRGRAVGIMPDMGVVDANGVVGIVYKASEHYALVISLLNTKMNLSCKVKRKDYFGYLNWEGEDPEFAYLKDLPRHAEFALGDTIITSGFSTVFPEGMLVGTVDDITDSNDGLSFQLKVKLASNFGALKDVNVIATSGKEERNALEESISDVKE